MDLLWWSIIIGVGVGVVLSVIFGVYSKSTANSYTRNIFGMSSNALITDSIFAIVAASFVVLTAVSIMVRDLAYPISKPWNFSLELFLMAGLSSSVIFIMAVLRGVPITGTTFMEWGVVLAKFGVLHLLLQISGFYSFVFS